jgi:hypothetical protein
VGFPLRATQSARITTVAPGGPHGSLQWAFYVLAWLAMFAYAEDTGRNRAKSSNREFSSPLAPEARDGSAAARS